MFESNKFDIILNIIRLVGYKVRVTYRKVPKIGYAIDGWAEEDNICIYLPPKPIYENAWSEAASILLHEYGHCIGYACPEKQAWKNADKFLRKFPLLKPRLYEDVKLVALNTYKTNGLSINV